MDRPSAGIDWASEEHALCVVDATGAKLAGELFSHDEAGLRELLARMRALRSAGLRSSAPTASWSTACWRRASPSCRFIPMR